MALFSFPTFSIQKLLNRTSIGFAAFAATAAPSLAETLVVYSTYAANEPDAALLERIAIDRFEGSEGEKFRKKLDKELRKIMVDGQPYFKIYSGFANNIEGVFTGSIYVDVEESASTSQRRKCVARDGDGKCTDKDFVDVLCLNRTVVYSPNIQLENLLDGRIIKTWGKETRDSEIWCDGGSPSESVGEVTSKKAHALLTTIRNDVAPNQKREKVKVLERKRGMEKDVKKRFKQAVKLTKKDPAAACAIWKEQQETVAAHSSILYNLGLCEEQAGRYEEAIALYEKADQLRPRLSYILAGPRRIRSGYDAAAQLSARAERLQQDGGY